MATPFWDVEGDRGTRSSAAPRWATAAILFTGEPQRFGLPLPRRPHWDPLWAPRAEAGLPIHFHIGSGGPGEDVRARAHRGRRHRGQLGARRRELFLKNGLQCVDLITSGVLAALPRPEVRVGRERHRLGPVRARGRRLQLLERLAGAQGASRSSPAPSEYFRRQVYAMLLVRAVAPDHVLERIPVDRILFETDFPHPTCLYGTTSTRRSSAASATSPRRAAPHPLENTAELYGIDPPTA